MTCDVFLSYRTHHSAVAQTLVESLRDLGVSVWRDQERICTGESITDGIKQGLSHAKLLIVYCTDDYLESEVCQWELTTAWLAGLNNGNPLSRIVIWMVASDIPRVRESLGLASDVKWLHHPKPGTKHWSESLEHIKDRVREQDTPIGAVGQDVVPWLPYTRQRSSRFVGRRGLIWSLASILHRRERVGTTGARAPGVCVIQGPAGIGKTLTVIEYCHLFANAYPGGIFWLQAGADWDSQISVIRRRLCGEMPHDDEKFLQRFSSLGRYLWILDDVISETSLETVFSMLAPTPNGETIVTTRSRRMDTLGMSLEIPALSRDSSIELLIRGRINLLSSGELYRLVELAGYHPLTLDLLGALVTSSGRSNPIRYWLNRLEQDDTESLELVNTLELQLPTGLSRSLSVLIQAQISVLRQPAACLLALAVAACFPLPLSLCSRIIDEYLGEDAYDLGLSQLRSMSLVADSGDWLSCPNVFQRGCRKIFSQSLIREMESKLVVHLCALLLQVEEVVTEQESVERVAAPVLKHLRWEESLESVVHHLLKSGEDPNLACLALHFVDFRLNKARRVVSLVDDISTSWLPSVIPASSESDSPDLLANAFKQPSRVWVGDLGVWAVARILAERFPERLDEAAIRFALASSLELESLGDLLSAAALSFAGATSAARLKNLDLGREAHIINQCLLFKMGNLGSEPMEIFSFARIWETRFRSLESIAYDCSLAENSRNKFDAALEWVSIAYNLLVRRSAVEIEELVAVGYAFADLQAKTGQCDAARASLDALFERCQTLPQPRCRVGRICILRKMVDVHFQLGLSESALRSFLRMIEEIESGSHLNAPVAERTIKAYFEDWLEKGRVDAAGTLLLHVEKNLEPVPLAFRLNGEMSCLLLRYALERSTGQALSETEDKICQLIRYAADNADGYSRNLLVLQLGLLHVSDFEHQALLQFVSRALPASEAVDFLLAVQWTFLYSPDIQKRVGYGRRASERLRRAIVLVETTLPVDLLLLCNAKIQLAYALCFVERNEAELALQGAEQIVSDPAFPAAVKADFLQDVGEARRFLQGRVA